jgi:cytochrome P450
MARGSEVLEVYGRAIAAITQEHISDWPVGEVREMRPLMQRITMRIILRVVFGLDQGERARELDRLLSRRLEMSATPLTSALLFLPWLRADWGPWSLGGRMRRLGERGSMPCCSRRLRSGAPPAATAAEPMCSRCC